MNETIQGFINAITSYGGDDYDLFEAYYTPQNEIRFQAWLKGQPKVDGVTLYRGYTFDRRYFEDADMKLGGYIGIDQLTQANLPSFTTDLFRASMYVNEYGEIGLDDAVRVLFVIRTHGRGFVDISEYSWHKEEREHKCLDSVRLQIREFQLKGGIMQITLEEV